MDGILCLADILTDGTCAEATRAEAAAVMAQITSPHHTSTQHLASFLESMQDIVTALISEFSQRLMFSTHARVEHIQCLIKEGYTEKNKKLKVFARIFFKSNLNTELSKIYLTKLSKISQFNLAR